MRLDKFDAASRRTLKRVKRNFKKFKSFLKKMKNFLMKLLHVLERGSYPNNSFTLAEMARPSARPANFLVAVPITLPISFGPVFLRHISEHGTT